MKQAPSCGCNSCGLSFCSGMKKLFHKQDREWGWGNACPQRDRLIFEHSCCNRDKILHHWQILLFLKHHINIFILFMIVAFVSSHFVHGIKYFPTYRTWSGIRNMLVFNMVG